MVGCWRGEGRARRGEDGAGKDGGKGLSEVHRAEFWTPDGSLLKLRAKMNVKPRAKSIKNHHHNITTSQHQKGICVPSLELLGPVIAF